jgi:HSP20 family protein
MAESTPQQTPDTTLQLMHEQVREIYRALTGTELPAPGNPPDPNPSTGSSLSPDEVAQRFALLEALARNVPAVAERVPAFSFTPPLDAIESEREVILEVGVPGVVRRDVDVSVSENLVTIAGTRPGEHTVDGQTYRHAEMPRGPFRRTVTLPVSTVGQPIVDVENGVIRVRLARSARKTRAQA